MIPDEAVRGRTPPPWFRALSGIERVSLWPEGALPWPPVARLIGIRTTHVVPGAITLIMPASEALLSANGQLEIIPALAAALEVVCESAMARGAAAVPLAFNVTAFRPARPQPGNMLARGRVLNKGRLYVFAEVQLEDPQGRHVAHATMHAAVRKEDPAPPAPPDPVPAVEEPTYDTPDPYLRTFEMGGDWQDRAPEGSPIVPRQPITSLFGLHFEVPETARCVARMPASEWFCAFDRSITCAMIATLCDVANWGAMMTLQEPGTSVAALDMSVRFLRSVPADGRPLRAESHLAERVPGIVYAETTAHDANGNLVALHSGEAARIDDSQRARRRRTEARRVLATLLFTDIVDSTRHAERLGDVGWRTLLEEHRRRVRQEISRYNGTEVDTAGDGFFVRFDSPARAVEAARAVRAAGAAQNIQIRAGIHTGECELEGSRLTGVAVHIAARIQAAAAPGQLLVSSTVKDLAMGAQLRFEDRGEHTLKGMPDPWRLWCVLD